MPQSRKNNGGGAGALLIYVIGAVVVMAAYIIAYVGPIAVFGWAIYVKRKLDRIGVADPKILVPNAHELQQILQYKLEINRCWDDIEQVVARGKQACLHRRQDDAFDERSHLGKELNNNIQYLKNQISEFVDQLSADESTIHDRLDEWINARSDWEAAKAGLVVFIISFILLFPMFLVQPKAKFGEALLWSSFVVSLVAFAAIALWRWLARRDLLTTEPVQGALAAIDR